MHLSLSQFSHIRWMYKLIIKQTLPLYENSDIIGYRLWMTTACIFGTLVAFAWNRLFTAVRMWQRQILHNIIFIRLAYFAASVFPAAEKRNKKFKQNTASPISQSSNCIHTLCNRQYIDRYILYIAIIRKYQAADNVHPHQSLLYDFRPSICPDDLYNNNNKKHIHNQNKKREESMIFVSSKIAYHFFSPGFSGCKLIDTAAKAE